MFSAMFNLYSYYDTDYITGNMSKLTSIESLGAKNKGYPSLWCAASYLADFF